MADPAPGAGVTSEVVAGAGQPVNAMRCTRNDGTFANDRSLVAGMVCRASGHARLDVVGNADRKALEALMVAATVEAATLHKDEWREGGRVGVGPCHGQSRVERVGTR